MTVIQRVLGGVGVAAALALVGAPAAHAGNGNYPPSVDPSQTATVTPQVKGAAATAPTSLAFTGSDVAVVGGAAAVLVAAGAGLVVRSRRRGEHV